MGIKDGRISGIGKAGNPDIMAGVTPGMVVGVTTEAIAGEGLVLTAGGIDGHIHFISPQQADEALASGITSWIGGGTGPATGTNATTCTPGMWNTARMLEAVDRRTGAPVVINTSLNTAGRPMVDDPRDALECFGASPVDALAIGPYLVRRWTS